jgi:hypothetical protein
LDCFLILKKKTLSTRPVPDLTRSAPPTHSTRRIATKPSKMNPS